MHRNGSNSSRKTPTISRDCFFPDPCAICGREARGFGYMLGSSLRSPVVYFCSMRCQDIGAHLANKENGMIDKTEMEAAAIKDTRRALAETLNELGLMAPFYDRKPEDIDRIITACISGFQEAMAKRVAEQKANADFDDEIPF